MNLSTTNYGLQLLKPDMHILLISKLFRTYWKRNVCVRLAIPDA